MLGALSPTPTLERIINGFSDEYLIAHGLSEKYRLMHETIEKLRSSRRGNQIGYSEMAIVHQYVTMAETTLREIRPALNKLHGTLLIEDMDPYSIPQDVDRSQRVAYMNILAEFEKAKFEGAEAIRSIRDLSTSPIYERFLDYHVGVSRLSSALRNSIHHLGELQDLSRQTKVAYQSKLEELEKGLRLINSSVRVLMPGAYSIKRFKGFP